MRLLLALFEFMFLSGIYRFVRATGEEATTNEKVKIKLVTSSWTGAALNVEIARQIIQSEFPHIDVELFYIGNSRETIEYLVKNPDDPIAALELWVWGLRSLLNIVEETSGAQGKSLIGTLEIGGVENLGLLGVVGESGWFIPDYIAEEYPETLSWEFYKLESNVALFATEETSPNGRFLGGDPQWSNLNTHIIANLDLLLTEVVTGNETRRAEIVAEAVENRQPILAFWWTPAPIVGRYKLVNVKLPDITDRCREYLEVGTDDLYDCGYETDPTLKLASRSFGEKAPDVMSFLRAFTITNDDQNEMLPYIDIDGKPIEFVAADWVKNNRERWMAWLEPIDAQNSKTSAGEMRGLEKSASLCFVTTLFLLFFRPVEFLM